jgi:hypothetical protein
MGLPWQVVENREPEPYDYEFDFNTTEAWRLSDKKRFPLMLSFAEMMGVDMTGVPYVPIYQPPEMEIPEEWKNRVLLSLMSFSDPINKTPRKVTDWLVLFDTLRKEYPDSKFGFIGGKDERLPDELDIKEDEYLLGIPFEETAHIMRHAKCVVTIDNGMAHLATSQKARQFYLAAACLKLYYIVGWGNPNLRVWHFDPFTADINVVNEALKSSIRDWKSYESTISN